MGEEKADRYPAPQPSRHRRQRQVDRADYLLGANPPGVPVRPFCFTCSMSDFWHEHVDLEKLDEALDVIDFTPWVTYLILTKRPAMAIRRLAALKRRLPPNV
jgi:hypothetical protein